MLELKHINKSYKTADFTQVALDDVSVTFRDNEFVAVLGPSGSGKTTMLNILGGLDHADSGDIVINGVSTEDYKSKDWDTYRNHRVGFIFQSYNLIPHQTVLSNVELALTLSGVGRAERRDRAKKALEAVGLGDHIRKRPSQLSGGQMQRVAIARALVNDPDIVLADEPTGALDTQTSVQVMDILKSVAKDRLVVMVTHNPELAEQYATRIVRVRDGKIEGDTDPIRPGEGEPAVMPAAGRAAGKAPSDHRESNKSSKHASMSLLTALSLSFNNLMSKKGRTILTAFAGSIGIIGIAAILALSNGVNNYIAKTEQDALSSYPLQITQSSADIAGLMGAMAQDSGAEEETDPADVSWDATGAGVQGTDLIPEATMVADMYGQVKSNDLSAFKTYLESGQSDVDSHVTTIDYKYGVTPVVYASDTADGITKLGSPFSQSNSLQSAGMSLGFGGASSGGSMGFQEMLNDQELLDSQYDVLVGSWPKVADEAVLVLDHNGQISDYTLYCLGVLDPQQLVDMVNSVSSSDDQVETPDTHVDLSYDDALKMTFKVVSPATLYQRNDESGTWTDMSDDDDFMREVLDQATTLKVVGVVRPNASTDNASLQQGIAYTHGLTQQLMDQAAQAPIVREQMENPDVDVFTGKTFEELQSGMTEAFDMNSIFSVDEEGLQKAFSFDSSKMEAAMGDGGMDFSGMDLSGMDLSSLDMSNVDMSQVDTSQLQTIFSPEAMQQLIDGAPKLDVEQLAAEVDPTQSQAMQQTTDALVSGFQVWFMPIADQYQTGTVGDLLPEGAEVPQDALQPDEIPTVDPKAVSETPTYDMQRAWNDYIATDEGKRLNAEWTAVATAQGQDTQDKLEAMMQDYVTYQFAPYFQQQMQGLMTQAAQVMAEQMGQALQATIASATQSIGAQLSEAIATQMQSQMGALADALQSGFSVDAQAFQNAIHFNLTQDDLTSLLTNYANASQLSYENNLKKLGYAEEANPTEIDIYPKSFDDKEAVLRIIDAYNDQMKAAGDDDKVISYTDMVGALLSSVTDIVNMISTVLIAFVSISLVVSSIMIAIITYISVLERKKEIGILRAMGASKLNVASIFNAETFIEGLISGVFAILVVLFVELPVNNFVYNWRHVENIMALSPANAIVLIIISVLLTLIAGVIPSSIAARRDPVEALRSE